MDDVGDETLEEALATGDPEAVLDALSVHSAGIMRRLDLDVLRRVADVVAPDGGRLPASVAWRIGFIEHRFGRYADALSWFDNAGRPDDADPDVAQLRAAEASSLYSRGDADASRAAADEALALARTCGSPAALAAAWNAQALAFALEGDRSASRHAYLQALGAATEADDRLALVRVHTNLGSLET
jgi:tetratricopeptide (TPR) repeat protein